MERTKLDLELNTPVTLQLIFDKPIIGENRYGPYYLYALSDEEQEYSFFAPTPDVHAQLSKFRAGDTVEFLKSAKQVGKKVVTTYEVRAVEAEPAPQVVSTSPAKTNGRAVTEAVATMPVNGNGNGSSAAPVRDPDALFMAMLVSFEDALRIQEKLNGMVDVNRIAITLFIARSKTNGNGLYA